MSEHDSIVTENLLRPISASLGFLEELMTQSLRCLDVVWDEPLPSGDETCANLQTRISASEAISRQQRKVRRRGMYYENDLVALWDFLITHGAWLSSRQEMSLEDSSDVDRFLGEAKERSESAFRKFGPHKSAEFAICRITEEVGELAQAATAVSKGRNVGRRESMYQEALDSVAMILRLLKEYPNGMEK